MMAVLPCALLLLQLSSVSAFPGITITKRFFDGFFPTNYPWQYEPRQTIAANRAHALQGKKVLNVGCWKGNYYINATIGTPPQKFELALSLEGRDSPESTWVPSKQCDQPVCQLHHCYDSSASKTYAHNDKKFFDQNTLISGFLSNDTICLEDLCVPNQSFGEAVKEGKWNKYKNRGAPFDGFIDICVTHSLFRSILAEHIKDKTVSLWITGNPLQTNDSCGKLILGSIDRELFSGPITWVEPQYGTSFMFESVFMGDTRLGSNDDCTGFLETLSPYIKGPAKAIEKIHSVIGAVQDAKTKLFTVQCKLVPHFPEITFTIYDTPFSFKGTDYIGEMDGKCYSLFRSIETSRNFWQFGSAFFPRVYTIFDTQRKKIGFADAKHL